MFTASSLLMLGNYYVYDSIGPVAELLSSQLGYTQTQIGALNAVYSLPNIFLVLVGGVSAGNLRDYAETPLAGYGIGSALYKPGRSPAEIGICRKVDRQPAGEFELRFVFRFGVGLAAKFHEQRGQFTVAAR